jgi:hypothetical protein
MTERRPARHSAPVIGLDARDAATQARKLPCAAFGSSHDQKIRRDIRTDDKPECSLYVLVNAGHGQESTGTFRRRSRQITNLVFVCNTKGLHPSHLLRLPDQDARALECERFVGDLKIAATQLRATRRRDGRW